MLLFLVTRLGAASLEAGVVEVIGFVMAFAALALIIGSLAQGVTRVIGFAILVAVALITAGPIIGRSSISNFFSPGAQDQADTQIQSGEPVRQVPANLPSDPVSDPVSPGQTTTTTATPNSGYSTNPGYTTYPNNGSYSTATDPNAPATSSGTRRGIRGGW